MSFIAAMIIILIPWTIFLHIRWSRIVKQLKQEMFEEREEIGRREWLRK